MSKSKQKVSHVDEQVTAFKSNFHRTLQKTKIFKADMISLKQQARSLSEHDASFRSLYSRITTQVNGMLNGKLNEERREKVTSLFNEYFE